MIRMIAPAAARTSLLLFTLSNQFSCGVAVVVSVTVVVIADVTVSVTVTVTVSVVALSLLAGSSKQLKETTTHYQNQY